MGRLQSYRQIRLSNKWCSRRQVAGETVMIEPVMGVAAECQTQGFDSNQYLWTKCAVPYLADKVRCEFCSRKACVSNPKSQSPCPFVFPYFGTAVKPGRLKAELLCSTLPEREPVTTDLKREMIKLLQGFACRCSSHDTGGAAF